MTDLGLKSFDKLYPMLIHKYKDLIVDQNATEKDKINQIIVKLNSLGKLSNDVVRDWNTVYQWVMNDGLTQDVDNKLEAMRANGEISQLLQNIFDSLTGDMTTLHTTAKDTLVNAINEVDDLAKSNQTQLTQIALNVKAYGAKGDGVTDDTAAFNSAIASITGKGTILLPEGTTYKLTGKLTFDVNKVKFQSKGAVLDFSSVTTGECIQLTGSIDPPYKQVFTVFEGVEIIGNGRTGSVTALKFDTASGAVSHINLKNVNIHGFGTGLYFGNHAYLIHFDNSDMYDCGIAIDSPSSTDSGERFVFSGGAIYNCDLVLRSTNGGADFYFSNMSLDYCVKYMDINGARVFIDQIHIEFNDTTTDYMFKTSGGNTGYIVTNSTIVGNPTTGTYETFYTGTDSDYVIIENCSVFNVPKNHLVTGLGFVKVKSLIGNVNSTYFLPSEGLSALPDPTLESANPLRQFTITTTGTATVALDNTTAASGTNSLKFNRSNLTDTCDAYIEVPMKPGDKAYMRFKHKYNATQGTETWQKWYIAFSYYDNYGTTIETYETFYDGNISSFATVFSDYLHNTKAKPGTAKLRVTFSMKGTGTAWIDDIYINIC